MIRVAIANQKGGVGKTTLSVNMGVALANLGHRTVVFDADLALANVEVVFNRCRSPDRPLNTSTLS